jgi:hypothetical protein
MHRACHWLINFNLCGDVGITARRVVDDQHLPIGRYTRNGIPKCDPGLEKMVAESGSGLGWAGSETYRLACWNPSSTGITENPSPARV